MMPIVFRGEAEDDLHAIIDWFQTVAPASLDNILTDIYRSLDQLSRFPRSGMPVPNGRFAGS